MTPKPSVVREFLSGAALLFRGLTLWKTAPRLMWLGMLPAGIVSTVILIAFIALGVNLGRITTFLTPFANGWDEPYQSGIRIIAGLAFVAVVVFLIVNTFTTLTLIVGEPVYERIWRHVELQLGNAPTAPDSRFWASLARGISTALLLLLPVMGLGVALFAIGFIPLVGQVLVPTLGAIFGGWFLALELTGLAFENRGLSLRERRKALRSRRAHSLGFGVTTYLCFLIPLGAVFFMPAATAGAAMLARGVLAPPVPNERV
jgi:CysZ protein